jgi:hypothetical protein
VESQVTSLATCGEVIDLALNPNTVGGHFSQWGQGLSVSGADGGSFGTQPLDVALNGATGPVEALEAGQE